MKWLHNLTKLIACLQLWCSHSIRLCWSKVTVLLDNVGKYNWIVTDQHGGRNKSNKTQVTINLLNLPYQHSETWKACWMGSWEEDLTWSNLIQTASMTQLHYFIQYSAPSVVCCYCRTWLQAHHTVFNMEVLEKRLDEERVRTEWRGRKDTNGIHWDWKKWGCVYEIGCIV